MANQISLLLPHLGGKAYTLRSGIVTAMGVLVHKAFNSKDDAEAADVQGESQWGGLLRGWGFAAKHDEEAQGRGGPQLGRDGIRSRWCGPLGHSAPSQGDLGLR